MDYYGWLSFLFYRKCIITIDSLEFQVRPLWHFFTC
jgi:hypothetical protein